VIAQFLSGWTCYDIMPESSKVVVFDRNIPIRLSYYALVEHEIGAAPLWDPLSQTLSGIITTLDFIEMLRYGHATDSILEILDSHSVASWRSLVTQLCESPEIADSLVEAGMPAVRAASMAAEYEKARSSNSMYTDPSRASLSISPESSLYDACRTLRANGVHWLPIVDMKEQLCLGVITHLAVLQYLVTHFVEDRRLFEQPISSLNIGTVATEKKKLVTATLDTKVHIILDLLCVNRISCVPIVDAKSPSKPIAVYARTNVIDLVSHSSVENSLDLTLGELIRDLIYGSSGSRKQHQPSTTAQKDGEEQASENETPLSTTDLAADEIPDRMRMHTCNVNDSLQQVFIKFAQVRVHRLLYVNDQGDLMGIVSLSDLLSYLLN
jgi:CBS-domain-containing membrane protein